MKKSLVIAVLAVFVMMGSNVISQAKTDSSAQKINKNSNSKVEAPAKGQQPPQFDGKNAPDGAKKLSK
ncbi:MAG: hypothetical protein LUH11_01815 [Candidatus Gastranaerophilales bacterium]|nr:hypothetical protein [Candidatus Gastranaerophilales bacterium]